MDALYIAPTDDSPEVTLDPKEHNFKIAGESRPENPWGFYGQILSWLNEYEKILYWLRENLNEKSVRAPGFDFVFELDYFNSSSAKYLMDIIIFLNGLEKKGYAIKIIWLCDELDDDMMDAGKEFEELVGFKFVHMTK